MKIERIYRNEEIEKTCYHIANTLCGKKIRSLDLSMQFCCESFGSEVYDAIEHFDDVVFSRQHAIAVHDSQSKRVIASFSAASIIEVSFEKTGVGRYVICVTDEEDGIRTLSRMEIAL